MVKIIFATEKYQAIKYILQIAGKILHLGIFPVAQTVKNLPAMQETPVRSLVRKILWRREWQSTPEILPGESHEQRNLAGHSLEGRRVGYD